MQAPSGDEATWWVEAGKLVLGGVACFVAGIVSATWAVASWYHGLDKRMRAIEAEVRGQVDDCEETHNDLEIAAKEYRQTQAQILIEIKQAIIRIHERIDTAILGGHLSARAKRRGGEFDHAEMFDQLLEGAQDDD